MTVTLDLLTALPLGAERFERIRSGCLENDVAWFAEHPASRYRIRPLVPGEVGLRRYPPTAFVFCVNVGGGVLARAVLGAEHMDRAFAAWDKTFAEASGPMVAAVARSLTKQQTKKD